VTTGLEATPPKTLLRSTILAALGIAAGRTAAVVAPAPIADLVEGVTRTMFLHKAKWMSVLVLCAGLFAAGIGSHLHRALATPVSDDTPKTPAAKAAQKPASDKPAVNEADKLVVTGRVLDPDGKPLAGARVFMPGAVWGAEMKAETLVDVQTGPEGQFRFRIERSQLVQGRLLLAKAEEYALDWIMADKIGKDEITLRLPKDIPIRGRVLDLQGRPIKGVSVSVRRLAAAPDGDLTPVLNSIQRDGNRVFSHELREFHQSPKATFFPAVKTDDAGRFQFTGLGAERLVVLWVEGPTIEHQVLYVLTRPGLNVEEIVKKAPNRIGIKTPLPVIYGPQFDHPAGPCKPLSGVVRDHRTGKPLEGVAINASVNGHWWENYILTKTDKEGRYQVVGLGKANSYHITALALPQDYLQGGKTITDTEALKPLTADLELVHGVRVRGRITDKQTGKPVPAAIWYGPLQDNKYFADLPAKDAGLFYGMGHRNEKDGSYSLLAVPGPGIIYCRAEVDPNPYTQVVVDPADRSRATIEEGIGESFIGAGGIYLTLHGHNAYRLIDPAADAKGIVCDMQFDKGKTRSGTVVDPDGKPITGVRVCGLNPLGGIQMLKDSSFKAVALSSAKPRRIAFVHPQRKLVGHVLVEADAREPITVRLQPGAVLTGRLLDEDGKPLAGINVNAGYTEPVLYWLADNVASTHPVQTDAEGRFRLEGVFTDLKVSLGLKKGNGFLVTEEKYQSMTLKAETKDLGDLTAKPFRPQ
jgi:protocatechuate 3,4-dioxygenase beta subunit